ncbi:hypothetical protein H0A36_26965 [Endozoicomonas sp. SM1973]|uniref:B box-type domain-containing protein n=1 Tax=Spartinivicinus marinus TaxID=2994442 RepID=A0A853I6X1_9GAMM|nr:hypothetical protein [Spartinivicinus marinus]MCX4030519.1 hypothetical protein [Spartinivicinus marinus]NYZ69660.1 hypothetical protein [Spartinivicinus marinus]
MKCFNHEVDAVGICKHCQRALCKDCCQDLEFGLACKGIHETNVEMLNSLIENNKRAYESQPKATIFGPLFYVFMGLVFSYYGYQKGLDSLPFILGSGFIVFGVSLFIFNKSFLKKVTTEYDTNIGKN